MMEEEMGELRKGKEEVELMVKDCEGTLDLIKTQQLEYLKRLEEAVKSEKVRGKFSLSNQLRVENALERVEAQLREEKKESVLNFHAEAPSSEPNVL